MSEALENEGTTPEPQGPNMFEVEKDSPNNMMEVLRRKREQARKATYLDLPVQGYGDLLQVRYTNAISWLALRDLMRKADKDKAPQAVLWANIDLLVQCTVHIQVRVSTDESWETIEDPVRGAPAVWGGAPMVKFFALEDTVKDPTARNIIRAIFPSDIAISAAAGRIMTWIQNMDENDGEEIQGE